MDTAVARQQRERQERTLLAWQTANFQGLKYEKLQEILVAIGGERRAPPKASPEELMTTMARWRVAMATQTSCANRRTGVLGGAPTPSNAGAQHGR